MKKRDVNEEKNCGEIAIVAIAIVAYTLLVIISAAFIHYYA